MDYEQGYKVGAGWTEDYRPGGPYVPPKPNKGSRNYEKKMAIYSTAVTAAAEWFRGFDYAAPTA